MANDAIDKLKILLGNSLDEEDLKERKEMLPASLTSVPYGHPVTMLHLLQDAYQGIVMDAELNADYTKELDGFSDDQLAFMNEMIASSENPGMVVSRSSSHMEANDSALLAKNFSLILKAMTALTAEDAKALSFEEYERHVTNLKKAPDVLSFVEKHYCKKREMMELMGDWPISYELAIEARVEELIPAMKEIVAGLRGKGRV